MYEDAHLESAYEDWFAIERDWEDDYDADFCADCGQHYDNCAGDGCMEGWEG